MIKVLHLTISSDVGGGPEHICQLISGLSTTIESHVACPRNGPYYKRFNDLTAGRITLIPFRRFDVKYLLTIYRYIKANNIHILHAHGKGAGIYVRILRMFMRILVIHTPHGINQNIETGVLNKAYLLFERSFRSLIDTIIYVSPSEYAYANKLNIWPGVSSTVIPNGTMEFSSTQILEWRIQIREKMNWVLEKVIITASRYDFQKNSIEFCAIAASLPNLLFVILGDGAQRQDCEDYCKNHHISNVRFLGNVDQPISYFAAADIYLSTARWEGLSMAILESMSVGLPVVASRVTGNVDLVKQGSSGYLYHSGELKEAIGSILQILKKDIYNEFSTNAKVFHKNLFSAKSMCKSTAAIYRKLYRY